MAKRRRLTRAISGVADTFSEIAGQVLQSRLTGQRQQEQQNSVRLNALMNDFDTAAREITKPENVQKFGPAVTKAQYQNLRRRLPAEVQSLLGEEPDFDALDSTPESRLSGLTKDIGAAASPEAVPDKPLIRRRMLESRVNPDVTTTGWMNNPNTEGGDLPSRNIRSETTESPELAELVSIAEGRRKDMLAGQTREGFENPLTGEMELLTEREQGERQKVKTGLTPQEEATKAGGVTSAQQQATQDVTNDPKNQQGRARGAAMEAGARKHAELQAELAANGITGQQAQAALALSDNYESASKEFFALQGSVRQIMELSKRDTAAGDLGMIFSFMKALDPTSAVREGEQANAQNAAGVPDRIRNYYNRMITGERLSPEQRKDFAATARASYTAAKQDHDALTADYTQRAQMMRVPPSLVIRTPVAVPEVTDETGGGALDEVRRRRQQQGQR